MQYSRPFDFNPFTGVETTFHVDGDGNTVFQERADLTPVIEANTVERNHGNPWNSDKTMRKVATIPLAFLSHLRATKGLDWWNEEHRAAIMALLNSSDYAAFRTDRSVI